MRARLRDERPRHNRGGTDGFHCAVDVLIGEPALGACSWHADQCEIGRKLIDYLNIQISGPDSAEEPRVEQRGQQGAGAQRAGLRERRCEGVQQ